MKNARVREILRFVITGGVCFLVEFAALVILRDKLGLDTLAAVPIAFLISVILNYLLCIKWVFTGDKDQGKNAFKAAVAAEDNLCDMHIGHDNNTFDLGINGLCYNLRTIEQFDFEKPWWPRRTTEELTVNGKLYAASNYASYAGINMCRVLSVNKDLLGEYNIPVPYDMVREGSWTWDNFYSIVGNIYSDEYGNGRKDKGDRFGIIAVSSNPLHIVD